MSRRAVGGARSYVHSTAPVPEQEEDGFYPTPPEATMSLVAIEQLGPRIWEPACGDGAISRVLEESGRTVISSDLVERGFGTPRVDFLMETTAPADEIVTNPPFKLAEKFLAHAWALGVRKVTMMLRLAWQEGDERKRLIFDVCPPVRIWTSSRRINFKRAGVDGGDGGGSMVAHAWFVFERDYRGPGSQTLWFDWADYAPEIYQEQKREQRELRALKRAAAKAATLHSNHPDLF